MAETSSVGFDESFDCAAQNLNWNGSQQTATSSALTELLTDFTKQSTTTTNKPTLSSKRNQLIKNGNGVDDQFRLDDDLEKKKEATTSSSLVDNNLSNISLNNQTSSFKLTDLNLSTTSKKNNISNLNSTIKKEKINSTLINQLNDRTFTDNNQSELIQEHTASSRKDSLAFRVGFKLEACDSTGTWYPAKVVAINEEDKQVLIHFIRWSKKFDEWKDMQSEQLRAITKEDENSEAESQKSFSIGKLVLASWSDNKKYPGTVKSVTTDGNYNIQFLDGYRKKVKKSLVELIPDDYQFNFNSPIDNLTTSDGKTMLNNINNLSTSTAAQSTQQTTNGSKPASIQLQNATSTFVKSKKRMTDHLVASKEFVIITNDHNEFKCEVENCNKSFRKEKLLNSHVKYYHPDVFESEEYKKRLEQQDDLSLLPDDSLSNDLSSFNSSRKTTINENSNTSWNNSEIATPKSNKISNKKNKDLNIEKTSLSTTTTVKNKSTANLDLIDNDQHNTPSSAKQQLNGEFENVSDLKNQLTTPTTNQKQQKKTPKKGRTSSKQKLLLQQQQTDSTIDLSKQNSSLNLSTSSPITPATTPLIPFNNNNAKSNRLSSKNDSMSYASDSTIEDSISSFDSPLTINMKSVKRDRAPGKRKIKEKIDPDCYFEDSNTVSTNKSFEKKSKDTSTTKRKPRKKNNQKCFNKELLEWKIDLQEKQQQGLLSADDERANLFFTNTPSTSSASESALAESAEFGTDFHNYEERRYRDTSPYSLDDYAHSPANSSYISDSFQSSDMKKKKSSLNRKSSNASFNLQTPTSTNKRQRVTSTDSARISSPTFLNAPILQGGYTTPSRKTSDRSIVLRDGFIFSANNDLNSSNVSPLSLHALEKPVPNTILPFWDARYVREIHESDEVDELVHCICDFKEESGLMIQCEICLTWQHGTCFDIEVEEKVPESYVCFSCKDPKAVRESQRYIYDQEWLKKGKNPSFDFISKQNQRNKSSSQSNDNVQQKSDSIKQMLTTNQLLSILLEVSQILRSLRYKMNLIKENNVKEMKYWESHLEEDLMRPLDSNDDLMNNEDELAKDKILDQNITQTEHDMIGDILDFSKNILGNEQGIIRLMM